MPTPEQAALALNYSVTEINYFLSNLEFREACERRGLPWKAIGSSSELTTTQIATGITLANFADTRSISEKLDQLGVSESQYFAWLQNAEYQQFVRKLADQSLENIHPEAILSFQKLIRAGDFNAIKYYFEITGVANSQDVTNLKIVIQNLIESVQRHVKDPVLLAKISQDIMGAAPVASSTTISIER